MPFAQIAQLHHGPTFLVSDWVAKAIGKDRKDKLVYASHGLAAFFTEVVRVVKERGDPPLLIK